MLANPGTVAAGASHVAVVIPCFKVKDLVLSVIERVPPEVASIHVVDDCCPQQTGLHVQSHCKDPRVRVVFHKENKGVGGATISGYREALTVGATVVVKIDGDGQMPLWLVPKLVQPLIDGTADYTKGNRFRDCLLYTSPSPRD